MNDKQTIQLMLDALEYHTEQTRPIQKTTDAIAAGREVLAQPEQETGNILMDSYNAMQAKKVAAQPEQDIADILAGELQISRATAYDLMREALAKAQPEQESDDLMIAYLSGVHAGKKEAKAKQEKPWVGLTEEENHIAEVLNKTLGLQNVADKLQEKNT